VPTEGGAIWNQRANLKAPESAHISRPIDGGYRLLDATAFQAPDQAGLGNTGRNAFRGPGMFNIDLGLSRSFFVPRLGERARVVTRVDAFNVLNHANLNQPDSLISSPTFGQAMFGRQGKEAGFPTLTPFRETARELQVVLRVEF
jgi:hypothetical protein